MHEINYNYDLSERDSIERNHISSELAKIKEKRNITNCSVLELGCGLGENLKVFSDDNNVLGIEGVPSIVEQAKRRNINVVLGNVEREINVEDSSQEFILCMDVLEHLQYPLELLVKARKKLKDNGCIIINVPNHFDWKGRIKILFGSGLDVHNYFPNTYDWDNPHIRFFTYGGLKDLLHTAGFKIEEDHSANFISIPLYNMFKCIKLNFICELLAKKFPSLFAAGFFIVASKQ